jgi:Uma2 family endonuclease
MSLYADTHHLGEVGIEKVMIRCNRNDYEPDICFFNNEKSQLFTNDQLLFPAPDLAVEIISASTEKIDRTIKFTDYALQGISEYWIIDPEKQTFEQYILPPNKNTYTLQSKLTQKGIIHAVVIQGFQIDIAELFV